MPGCYAFMERAAPGAPFVEVPQFGSGGSGLNSVCTYWQSFHRGRTTAGYCGQGNAHFDNLLAYNSPFYAEAIAQPTFLADPDRIPLALDGVFAFRDYAWLYLTAHDLRFVVVHRWPGAVDPASSPGLDRLKSALAAAKVYEDAGSIVYDRDRLPAPARPVMITTGGWRIGGEHARVRVAERSARLLVYNPDPTPRAEADDRCQGPARTARGPPAFERRGARALVLPARTSPIADEPPVPSPRRPPRARPRERRDCPGRDRASRRPRGSTWPPSA